MFAVDDALLREPNLWIPGKKPVGRVKVDWSNPLANGLVGMWLLDSEKAAIDLTGNNRGTPAGTTGTLELSHSGHYGRGVESTGDNQSNRFTLGSIPSTNPLSCSDNNQVSIFALTEMNTNRTDHGNTNPRILDKSNSGNGAGGYLLALGLSVGTPNALSFAVGGTAQNSSANILTDGKVQAIGVTYKSADTRFFVDGVNVSNKTALTQTIATTTTNAALLNWNHTTDRQCLQPVYVVCAWDRQIEDAEMISISNDPYQFLIPA